MIIRRLVRHQFRPHNYESLVLEADVALDTLQFEGDERQADSHVQFVLDELLAEDLERARRVDTEEQTYVQDWLSE